MGSFRSNLRRLPLAALFLSTTSALPSESRIHTRDVGSFTSLGCFVDSGSRILPNKVISANDMTAAKCAVNCAGYDYFGTQWSSECYCGSDTPTNPAPAAECNMPCSGDPEETCGAGMRLNVYKVDPAPAAAPTIISGFEYKGCYADNVPQRVLAGITVTTADMTLEKCAATCSGYSVFGVEYSSQCYCGTTLDAASTKVPEVECSMDCSGDDTQHCGGPNRLNVYQIPSPVGGGVGSNLETVGEFRYASCWTDDVNDRTLKAVDWRTDDMTVEKCAERCSGYSYFGLEYARECYCSNDLAHSSTSAPEKECAMLCLGNSNQLCGGGSRLNLYTRVAASTLVSSSTTAPQSSIVSTPEQSSSIQSSTVSSDTISSSSVSSPASSPSSTVWSTSSSMPSSTSSSTSTSSTSQGPELTTITSCPPEPTYNGTPERCFNPGGLPAACRQLSSAMNSRSVSSSVSACKAALTRYGMTPVPAATACFPTTAIPAVPSPSVASSIRSSVYECIQAPTASLVCNFDADCVTKTYTVGQVPSATPTVGVDLLNGDGTFESGNLGNWVVGTSPHLVSTTVTNARPHSGSRGLLMRYLNVNGGGNSMTYTLPVIPGRRYDFTVYYQHTNPSSYTSLYLYVYPDILQTDFTTAQLNGATPNVWGTRTITFTATASWVQLVVHVGGNVGSTNDVYIDDVTLKRLT